MVTVTGYHDADELSDADRADDVQPVVSIVIRTRNERAWLPTTLRGVLGQSFADPIEIIVVDSGSTDDTLSIAEASGARIVHLRQEYRAGLAINAGVAASRAPICVFLSAPAFPIDDQWLEHLIAPLRNGPSDLVGTFSRHQPLPGACPSEDGFLTQVFTETTTSATFSAVSGAVRRDALIAHPWHESCMGIDDLEWAARIRAAGLGFEYAPKSVVVRSHRLDAGGWFARVSEGTAAQRDVVIPGGYAPPPMPSGIRVAASSIGGIVASGAAPEVARFIVLAPLLAIARSPLGPRVLDRSPGFVARIGSLDRRAFRPQQRWDRAFADFARNYWAAGEQRGRIPSGRVRPMGTPVSGRPVPTIDQALRYRPIVKLLERVRSERVLEVGSGCSGLAAWWPGSVVGVDMRFDGDPLPNLTTVQASATALPFPDGAFQVVVCTDVLEHLPQDLRKPAFNELLRVSSDAVWLAFPAGEHAVRHDQAVLAVCRAGRRDPPGWLLDHLEFGLPSPDDVATWPAPGFRRLERRRMSWWMHLGAVISTRIPGGSLIGRVGRSNRACDLLRRVPGGECHYELLLERVGPADS